jgi:hypothetical protein
MIETDPSIANSVELRLGDHGSCLRLRGRVLRGAAPSSCEDYGACRRASLRGSTGGSPAHPRLSAGASAALCTRPEAPSLPLHLSPKLGSRNDRATVLPPGRSADRKELFDFAAHCICEDDSFSRCIRAIDYSHRPSVPFRLTCEWYAPNHGKVTGGKNFGSSPTTNQLCALGTSYPYRLRRVGLERNLLCILHGFGRGHLLGPRGAATHQHS